MSAAQKRVYLLLCVMVLLAGGLLAIPQKDVISSRIDVRLDLPERVGAYTARERRFCQSEQCLRSFPADQLEDVSVCPFCEGELAPVTLAEKRILPSDTIILKKEYVDALGRSVYVSVVISGAQQKSLHRPQQCLPAQGLAIDSSDVIQVPLANREPLDVMLLGLHWRRAVQESGRGQMTYADWFAGGERETASHIRRLFWMSFDRIVKGVVPRWAYITVSMQGGQGHETNVEELGRFISEFYPLIRADA